MKEFTVDPNLEAYATTQHQRDLIALVNRVRGYRAAARELGQSHDSVRSQIKDLKKHAARKGYAPGHWTGGTAPGYLMGKVTTHVKDGKVTEYWARQHPELAELLANARAAIDAMKEEIPPARLVRKPRVVREDLCTQYTITDYHFGMQAHASEGDGIGADWNLEIAEDMLVKAIENLVAKAPDSGTAILGLLGDLVHFDGPDPVTPTHRHPLDAAARQRTVVRVVVRAIRRVVQLLLTKHQRVQIVVVEGNHDLASTPWLREILLGHYENESRVEVIDNDLPYQAVEFGLNFIGFHHTHRKKKESLPLLFAAMFRAMWGRTKKGYIHTGHYHHADEKEHPGVTVIQHRSMAAPDSHALRGGWFSEREMQTFHYHAKYGVQGRDMVTPDMLEAA